MRILILAAVLGMAFPAFAADDAAPMTELAAPDEGAATPEATRAEAAPAPAAEPEVVEAAPARPPVPADAVARGMFATAIDQREPVDSITALGSDRDRIYYFTELVGISGREVTHRWEYRGQVVAEVPIAIGGPRWRAYSSKHLDVSQLGEWTVSVIDESGNLVHKDSFVYEEAAPEPEIAAPAATPAVQPVAPVAGEEADGAPTNPASPALTQP